MENKKECNLLDDAISIGAVNTKYPFKKVIKSKMREQLVKKLGVSHYKNLLMIEDFCIDPYDNSVNFKELEYLGVSKGYIRQIRSILKKAYLVKKLNIKGNSKRYLNPILSHSGRTNTVLNLFYEFKDETFAEYY